MKIPNQVLAFAGESNITPYKMFVDYFNHYKSMNGSKTAEYQTNVVTPEGVSVPLSFSEKEEKIKDSNDPKLIKTCIFEIFKCIRACFA